MSWEIPEVFRPWEAGAIKGLSENPENLELKDASQRKNGAIFEHVMTPTRNFGRVPLSNSLYQMNFVGSSR